MRAPAFPVALLLCATLAPLAPAAQPSVPVCVRPMDPPPYYQATVGSACGPGYVVGVTMDETSITITYCAGNLSDGLPECRETVVRCPGTECVHARDPERALEDLLA